VILCWRPQPVLKLHGLTLGTALFTESLNKTQARLRDGDR